MKFFLSPTLLVLFFHIFSMSHSQQLKKLAAVKKDNKWGAIDGEGRMAIPCIYDAMVITNSELIVVKKDGKFGFIDRANNVKIAFQYDAAKGFYEQKAFVKKGTKYGCINEQGALIIDYKFDDATFFSYGLAGIKVDTLWGFINEHEIVIAPAYHRVDNFHDQYCIVSKKGKEGIINRKGKTVLPIEYGSGSYFLSNYDVVIANTIHMPFTWSYNEEGKRVLKEYDGPKYYYIFKLHDTTYSKVTERNLKSVESRSAGYSIFYNITYGEKKLPINSVFPKEDIGTGVINKDGKVVVCCYNKVKFLDATHFAYAQWGDFEKATVVDTNGRKMHINGYKFDYVQSLWDNVLIVFKHKWGGINLYGEQVIDFKYDHIYGYKNGTFLAKISDKYYVINLDEYGYQSEPLPFYIYDCWFYEKVIIVESGGKLGVLDYKGNVLFEPQFDLTFDFHYR